MLKVIVEIHPFGASSEKYEIGELIIINDLSNPKRPEYGNYVCQLTDGMNSTNVEVRNHNRSDGWIKLLHKIMGEYLKIDKESKNKKF